MKKITSLFAIIIMVLMSFSFVSCDEDEAIADTLWGTWEGNMYIKTEWNGHVYNAKSIIQFDKDYDYSTSGTGYWIDYYSKAPYDYFASHIRWYVSDKILTIHSLEDDMYFRVCDFSLSDRRFSGYIECEDGSYQEFYLTKTSSPYWNEYNWGWGHYDYPYYAPEKDVKSTRATDGNMPRRFVQKD